MPTALRLVRRATEIAAVEPGSRAPHPDPVLDRFLDELWAVEGLARLTLDAYRRDLTALSSWLAARGSALTEANRAELGEIAGPATANLGGESNFLHVRVPRAGIEFDGLRAPSYTGGELIEYWVGLVNISRACAGRRILFMGDLNTDPEPPRRSTARYLQELKGSGWTVPAPEGEWSFISKTGTGTRIDHAIVASTLQVAGARYVASSSSLKLAAPNRVDAVSDHAALVIELAAGPA